MEYLDKKRAVGSLLFKLHPLTGLQAVSIFFVGSQNPGLVCARAVDASKKAVCFFIYKVYVS
jgi:hypothetical protein